LQILADFSLNLYIFFIKICNSRKAVPDPAGEPLLFDPRAGRGRPDEPVAPRADPPRPVAPDAQPADGARAAARNDVVISDDSDNDQRRGPPYQLQPVASAVAGSTCCVCLQEVELGDIGKFFKFFVNLFIIIFTILNFKIILIIKIFNFIK
jgi:hypothetical protein